MIYKNVEFHNIEEFIQTENGVSWLRFPADVCNKMESEAGKMQCRNSTGVELRFIMVSDTVTIKMRDINPKTEKTGVFHIYRGGIQGGWEDHENNKYISRDICEYHITKSKNIAQLEKISSQMNSPWNPNLVRVIFDRSNFEIVDIIGEVLPPKKEDMPSGTIMFYGSSVTHGSNSIDASHAWSSMLAHNLSMDSLNKGQAGSCMMEKSTIDYIADKGVKNEWDIAVLELGINVLLWEKEKIADRVSYAINQVASKNPQKNIFVISPLYCHDDFYGDGNAQRWRDEIYNTVKKLKLNNVTYIDGKDLIGDMSYISADMVHPNIYGVLSVAEKLTQIVKQKLA